VTLKNVKNAKDQIIVQLVLIMISLKMDNALVLKLYRLNVTFQGVRMENVKNPMSVLPAKMV